MRVFIPQPLLAEVVDEQDRVRKHIKFFVNREQVGRLDVALEASDEVHIFQALSGG